MQFPVIIRCLKEGTPVEEKTYDGADCFCAAAPRAITDPPFGLAYLGRMNRRGFLSMLAGATLDPERLLWRPGAKLISIPEPTSAAYPDFFRYTDWVVYTELISRQEFERRWT
jgi:hypothetical protein